MFEQKFGNVHLDFLTCYMPKILINFLVKNDAIKNENLQYKYEIV